VLLKRALAVNALQFPDGKDVDGPARPRVMQWTAYHLAQTIFFTALDKLFPSLRAELAAGDVPYAHMHIERVCVCAYEPHTGSARGNITSSWAAFIFL
jgi:hypothetical protein